MKDIRVLSAILCVMTASFFVPFKTPLAQNYIEASVGNAMGIGEIGGRTLFDSHVIQAFYAQRENKPYWLGDVWDDAQIQKFIEILEQSWTHGLNPAQYHVEQLKTLSAQRAFVKQAEFELLLTDAFIRYARDMSGMRVDPKALRLDAKDWRMPMEPADILTLLSESRDIQATLTALEPPGTTYQALRKELIRLSYLPLEPYLSALPLKIKGVLKPGKYHPWVNDLRLRLGVEPQTKDLTYYDDRLFSAVMQFQQEHGLDDDGVIGQQTLKFLNRTNQDRIAQIIANLERLRWINTIPADRFVMVNIPSATLWAIDNGQVALEMPVIVGKRSRQTPTFVTEIEGVRFNPNWTVPPTIKRVDIWPKLKQDPEYLTNSGMELFQGYGRNTINLDPTAIDWENMKASELHQYRMVQVPGAHNPLGQVRVLMPNKYNIYLHDTNKPHYFKKPDRAQSSGCVRLKNPEDMAQFIMQTRPGWSEQKMNNILASGRTQDISVPVKTPVYILYYTVWLDELGHIQYGNDVYKKDQKLLTALKTLDGVHFPVHNSSVMPENAGHDLISTH